MKTIQTSDLLVRWRHQYRRQHSHTLSPHGYEVGAIGFLADGNHQPQLVEIGNLLVLVVYDAKLPNGRVASRLLGYGVTTIAHGLQWGGAANSRLLKDLTLQPRARARGMRIDLWNSNLLQLALRLERRIDQAHRFQPSIAHRRLRLPRPWAGFLPRQAAGIRGDGPEFQRLCGKFNVAPEAMLAKFRRSHEGLDLYPLEYVGDQFDAAVAVFADLEHFPRCHAFGLGAKGSGLVGYQAASAFDFLRHHF
jgi:hypothetical protein